VRTELISIPTDTVDLDGAWYVPERGEVLGVVLLLHGNTMNFYTGAPRFLPPALTARGFACLAFNRRGHDILSIRDSRAAEGGAFQTAAEGMADTVYAAGWAAAKGHPVPFLVGHSNGGTLAVAHAAYHDVRGLALLSAHMGGAHILQAQAAAGQLTADRTDEFVALAERMVDEGRGDELLLVPGWWYVISATSLLDRLRSTPDVLALAPLVRCPSLFVRGDSEPADVYPAERFAQAAGGPCEVVVLSGCDHFYRAREGEAAELVGDWLVRHAKE
jgi:pimeloyl-ACP methyl ester carboxylesterase